MAVNDLLNSTATVNRKLRAVPGAKGTRAVTYIVVATDLACRVSIASGRDQALAGERTAIVTHAIYFDVEPDPHVQKEDRLTIDGRVFDVRIPALDGPGYPYRKVLAEEYQRGQ